MGMFSGVGGSGEMEEEVEEEEQELGIAETYNDYMPSKCKSLQYLHLLVAATTMRFTPACGMHGMCMLNSLCVRNSVI